MRKWMSLTIAVIVLLGWAGSVAAQGGVITKADENIRVTSSQILYHIDAEKNQTTISLDLQVFGDEGETFGILLPVPTIPLAITVRTSEISWNDLPLQNVPLLTFLFDDMAITLSEPPPVCSGLYVPKQNCGSFGIPHLSYLDIAPQILTTLEEIQQWAQLYEYAVDMDALAAYHDKIFVAVHVQVEGSGEMASHNAPQLSITYPGTEIILPQELMGRTAIAIFADQPYTIENYTSHQLEPANFHRSPELDHNTISCSPPYFFTRAPLDTLLSDALHGQNLFVTVYAGPVDVLYESLSFYTSEQITEFIGTTSYLTVLYVDVPYNKINENPAFVPDGSGTLINNNLDISNSNAFDYWGCTSSPSTEEPNNILTERTYIPVLGKTVAHPEGWVFSSMTVTATLPSKYCGEPSAQVDIPLDILAPQQVTLNDLETALTNPTSVPMMVFGPITDRSLEYILGAEIDNNTRGRRRYTPLVNFYSICAPIEGVEIWLLADDTDENTALYESMIDDALSFNYYVDPQLPQTAFITGKRAGTHSSEGIVIGYPDEWSINTTNDWSPAYSIENENGDRRLEILKWAAIMGIVRTPEDTTYYSVDRDALYAAIRERYGLPADYDLEAHRTGPCYQSELRWEERLIPFEDDERRGAFFIYQTDVIEISVPLNTPEAEWDLLRHIAKSIQFRGMCG